MDLVEPLQFVFALAAVLALIGLLAVAARRFGLAGAVSRSSGRRLAIVEAMALDGRRRLVLLRRDDLEHLIILGPSGETVVESRIEPTVGFAATLAAAGAASTPNVTAAHCGEA